MSEWFVGTGIYQKHLHITTDTTDVKLTTRFLEKELQIKLSLDEAKQLALALDAAIKEAESYKPNVER